MNSLTKLLENGNIPPVREVLFNPDLPKTVSGDAPELREYLFVHGKIDEVLDWALSDKHNRDKNDFMLNRNARTMFASVANKLQQQAWEDGRLPQRLRDFFKTDSATKWMFAGHFADIYIRFSILTSGKIVEQDPNLYTNLITHINITGHRSLLENLLGPYGEQLAKTFPNGLPELLRDMFRRAKSGDVNTIRSIFWTVSRAVECGQSISDYQTKEIVQDILDVTTKLGESKSERFAKSVVFDFLENVLDGVTDREILDCVDKYGRELKSSHPERLPMAFGVVYRTAMSEMFQDVFKVKNAAEQFDSDPTLVSEYVTRFTELPDEKILEILSKDKLDLIIDMMSDKCRPMNYGAIQITNRILHLRLQAGPLSREIKEILESKAWEDVALKVLDLAAKVKAESTLPE